MEEGKGDTDGGGEGRGSGPGRQGASPRLFFFRLCQGGSAIPARRSPPPAPRIGSQGKRILFVKWYSLTPLA
eukprot:scaffold25072_cov56-Isochrysis_galbana.AAC.1